MPRRDRRRRYRQNTKLRRETELLKESEKIGPEIVQESVEFELKHDIPMYEEIETHIDERKSLWQRIKGWFTK